LGGEYLGERTLDRLSHGELHNTYFSL
jgi:hypothetical protein